MPCFGNFRGDSDAFVADFRGDLGAFVSDFRGICVCVWGQFDGILPSYWQLDGIYHHIGTIILAITWYLPSILAL